MMNRRDMLAGAVALAIHGSAPAAIINMAGPRLFTDGGGGGGLVGHGLTVTHYVSTTGNSTMSQATYNAASGHRTA